MRLIPYLHSGQGPRVVGSLSWQQLRVKGRKPATVQVQQQVFGLNSRRSRPANCKNMSGSLGRAESNESHGKPESGFFFFFFFFFNTIQIQKEYVMNDFLFESSQIS